MLLLYGPFAEASMMAEIKITSQMLLRTMPAIATAGSRAAGRAPADNRPARLPVATISSARRQAAGFPRSA
jgi:hypothetical protein